MRESENGGWKKVMCADIVIIGGGPVGLWTAIQLKKRDPALDIRIYERYETYRRSHVLKLERQALSLYSKKRYDWPEAKFLLSVTGKNPAEMMLPSLKRESVYLRTNDLEDALKTYAHDLGLNIVYDKISSPQEAERRHPECKNFIAADGAHSAMRTALIGGNAVKSYPLQHIVEIKYEVEGKTAPLTTAENFRINKQLDGMVFEYVGREKNGKTPVTLRFFIDENTYRALPDAGFKNPLGLDDPRLPENLAQDIEAYMAERSNITKERPCRDSAKIGKLVLSLYRARKFAVKHGNKSWFLAGDAAMGVPYFRSLNAGMIISSQLGYILTRKHLPDAGKRAAYNAVQPLDTAWEFTAAHGKNTGLNLYDGFRKASAKMTPKSQKKPARNPKKPKF